MATITALNVRLGMDASNFASGANLASKEVNRVASIMRQSEPAAVKYKREVELLNRAFSESGRNSREYANALDFLKNKYKQGTPEIKGASGAVDQLKSSMLSAVPGGNMLAGAMKGPTAAILALAAAVAVAVRGMSEAAQRIDETAKAARTAGLAFGDLVAIQMLAGETVGVGAEGINKGVRELVKRLAEARVKGGELANVLRAAGLSVEDLAAGSPIEAWKQVTDVIAGIPNRAEQIRVATLAVGKEGAKLVEMFAMGSGAIDDMRAEAERLGAVIADDAVASVELMNDRFGRAGQAVDGLWNTLLVEIAPAMTSIAQLAEDFFVSVRHAYETYSLIQPVVSGVVTAITKLIDGLRFGIAVWSDTLTSIASIKDFLTGGELNREFSETNRLLDEIEARSNGAKTATQLAADAAEALAVETQRAADEAAKVEEKYTDRVKQLEIERLQLEGNVDLARQMQLAAEGYSQTQIDVLMAMEKQNKLIEERTKSEQKAADEEAKRQAEATKNREKDLEQLKRDLEAVDKEFTQQVSTAMKAAATYYQQQKALDDKRREDASRGPGAGMEVGSADAAKFMADQVNAAIGATAVPPTPTPGEKEIADKTRELLVAQLEANRKQEQQLEQQKMLLAEFRENKFMRTR